MPSKDAQRMANSVDPDQTAPLEQSDQNLHCLLRHTCPNILNFYGKRCTPTMGFHCTTHHYHPPITLI